MNTLNKQFGENLRLVRQSKNLTQENLASMLDKSHSWLAKIERGKIDVSLSAIEQIAEVLGEKPEKLISFERTNIFNFNDSQQIAAKNYGVTIHFQSNEELIA